MPTPSKIGVAIIDEGCISAHFTHPERFTFEEVIIGGEVLGHSSRPEHGINVANLISEHTQGFHLVSVKLQSENRIHTALLCDALEYLHTRADVHIINISLGVLWQNGDPVLRYWCQRCQSTGKAVVASAHFNNEFACYPAAYPEVLGVGAAYTGNNTDYSYQIQGHVNVYAKGSHQKLLGPKFTHTLRGGTSYAAANFSGILATMFQEYGVLIGKDLIEVLTKNSKHVVPLHPQEIGHQTIPIKALQNQRILTFSIGENLLQDVLNVATDVFIVDFPTQPKYSHFRNLPDTNLRVLPGFVSEKLFENIECVVVGDFMEETNILHKYFGFHLLGLIKNSISFKNIFFCDKFLEQLWHRQFVSLSEVVDE